MNVLRIDNDYSSFLSDDYAVKHELWDRLRFRDKNYFHNRRYKMRLWDGYVEFFKLENGKFLTGLLPEVGAVLKHMKAQYTVDDRRTKLTFAHKEIDQQFLNQWLPAGEKQVELYDYQADLVNQVLKHRRGIVFAPTGAGKSLMMLCILKCVPPGTPTLVLQNRVSLAQQNYNEFKKWGIPDLGTLWGGSDSPNIVTVASVQSVVKMEKELSKIRVLIVDEIHDMMSALPKAVYRRLKACDTRVAVSATPFKFGGTDAVQKFSVRGFFGPVLKTKWTDEGVLTTAELQERGILSKSKCVFYPVREPKIPHDIYIDAVTRGIAENYHFHQMVARLAKKQKGRTLILVDRVAHGDALHALLPKSLWVQGKDDIPTRLGVIEKLTKAKGKIVAIATQQIFNTGVSFKIHSLINAASGQADHQIIQRMGRGLRTADDKESLDYYDFFFYINDYLEEHSRKRVKILTNEGHDVVVKEEIDF